MIDSIFSSKLPYWHFHQNFMVFKDGSLGAGFKIKGIDVSSASDEVINSFCQNLEHVFNSADSGYRFQVFYNLSSKVKHLLENHKEINSLSSDLYKEIASFRYEHFSDKANKKEFFNPEIYFFIRSEGKKYSKLSLFQRNQDFQKISTNEFEKKIEKFKREVDKIKGLLHHTGLNPKTLDSNDWFKLVFEYFNLDRFEKIGIPRFQEGIGTDIPSFSSQTLLSDLLIKKDSLKIGDYFLRAVTLKTLPEAETYSSISEILTKIPFHFFLVQNILIHNQAKATAQLQIQRKLTHSMAVGGQNMVDLENESRLVQIEELIGELLEGTEKLVSLSTTVIIYAKIKNELDEKCDEVLKAFRQMGNAEGILETLPLLEIFLKNAPGICDDLRFKKMKSSNATHLIPLFDSWRGDERPVCLIPNRDGVPVFIDPFAKELSNWNALIFGGSGSGKSFSIIQLMLQFYGQNPTPKIVWIDNGASSQRLLEVLGGEFLNLTLDSAICLNVFDLPKGETTPSPDKVKLILAALEVIFKEENSQGIPKRDKALLEECIFITYQTHQGKIPTLSDFKSVLQKHSYTELRKYADILYSWTGKSAYGRILDGPSNVELSKDLVTIELKGLDTYPDLQNVLLLLFTDFIKNEAASDLSRPYLLIIDEAWKLFSTSSGLAFTLEAYRTFRKFNGGIWGISQNYKDFLFNQEIKNAVFPNISRIFVLGQRNIDWKDFQICLDLNDNELDVIKGLKIAKGKFAEVYYIQNENRSILNFNPDPLGYWIGTSDGNDKIKISEIEKLNPHLDKLNNLKILAIQTRSTYQNKKLDQLSDLGPIAKPFQSGQSICQ